MTKTNWTRSKIKQHKGKLVKLTHLCMDGQYKSTQTGIIEATSHNFIMFNVNNEKIEIAIKYSNILKIENIVIDKVVKDNSSVP